jgi:hypothetical protein
MKKLIPVLFLLLFNLVSFSQDTLPKFSARNIGNNRIVIGWVNKYTNVKQISIQRSFDSLTNFKTILTVPDPTSRENGFVDTKATNDRMFYRIYVMLEKGFFLFSQSKRPFYDSAAVIAAKKKIMLEGQVDKLGKIDSLNGPNASAKEKSNGNVFVASKYVYTLQDGYVRIKLPDDADSKTNKKYSIKFFDEAGKLVFEIKEITLSNFKIDKSNFYHSGWFNFELYEDGKLFEKHKFLIPKEL